MARHLLPPLAQLCSAWCLGCLALPCGAAWHGFTDTGTFDEQAREINSGDGVRIVVNASDDHHYNAARPTTLIIYALPNGSTIEQTIGCQMRDGLHWHYDIQHIAAQTRILRQHAADRNIVVAYVEADTLSWPAWRATRPDHPRTMAAIVDSIRQMIPSRDVDIVLAAHSGGGAFLLGYIDAAPTIPASVARIVFLDANYSFDAARHGRKLIDWLGGERRRQLVVLAYDDREVTYQGKKVVGPTGGTFRATQSMRHCFAEEAELTESSRGPFIQYDAIDGRLHMLVHRNPENKILHTALVGDMNGYLYALARGTDAADTWGTLGGPRAYTDFIAAAPGTDALSLPDRPADAEPGSAFIRRIKHLSPAEREAAIVEAIVGGNFPQHLRQFHTIEATMRAGDGDEHTMVYQVMPDYLAVGSDDDFVRMPMTPMSAQKIAERFGCTLPTAKMVDQIYRHAQVKLEPQPMTEARESIDTFAEHHAIIERQRAGQTLGLLVAGIKKDVVLTNRLAQRPGRVAIYGWHRLSGKPIQPLTTVHVDTYVDYSHGVRLVKRQLSVDGRAMTFSQLARDPVLSGLISNEGALEVLRYDE